MKKLLLLFSMMFLAACSPTVSDDTATETTETTTVEVTETATQDQDQDAISIDITIEVEGEVVEEDIDIQAETGAILLEVMREHYEVEDENDFITSINGHEQDPDANMWWLFDLNGEMAPVGAHEYELEDGDVVHWTLEALE